MPLLPQSGVETRDEIMSFVERFGEGVIFLDREWRITFANESARRISRIEDRHINGASHWEIYPDTVGTPQEDVYRASMEKRVSLEHEFYYPPFNVWISLTTFPISAGIAVHYRDISRLKQAEKALLQSEKLAAVGRLASSISHEINNPLESVTNLLYLIGLQDGLPPVVRQYVDLAQAELARVSQIVTQTLRFHRQSARPTLTTATQLIEPVINLYQGRILSSSIRFETRYRSQVQLQCFESEIRQVLNNLIANAVDAMRSGGKLTIRVKDGFDSSSGVRGVSILVADTGHGMSRATMARIFEPFFSTKDLNGTGLGLWVSTEIVERHRGRLTVRSSENPRLHGSVFRLFLPLR